MWYIKIFCSTKSLESGYYAKYFRDRNYELYKPKSYYEGQGDHIAMIPSFGSHPDDLPPFCHPRLLPHLRTFEPLKNTKLWRELPRGDQLVYDQLFYNKSTDIRQLTQCLQEKHGLNNS